jgi:hypothetical protein
MLLDGCGVVGGDGGSETKAGLEMSDANEWCAGGGGGPLVGEDIGVVVLEIVFLVVVVVVVFVSVHVVVIVTDGFGDSA